MREGVERDQVDLARYVAQQLDHLRGMLGLVVDVLEQGVFHSQDAFATQGGHIAHARFQQYLERVLLVDRHQLVAQLVIGGVQRQGQRHVDMLGQFVDHRHHARGGQGDATLGNAIAQIVHHDLHGGDDIVEIQQRLAHAHHDHVGDGAVDLGRNGPEGFIGKPHLANHFGGGEVAVEALLAGGAETAIQGAAGLGRNAEGTAVVGGNVDGLDAAAGGNADHPFTGAVGGNVFTDHFRRANFGNGLELFAQGLADVRHGGEIIDAKMVNPFHHLAGTEAFLPDRVEELFHFRLGQAQQVDFASRCRHGFTLTRKLSLSEWLPR